MNKNKKKKHKHEQDQALKIAIKSAAIIARFEEELTKNVLNSSKKFVENNMLIER